MDSIEDIEYLAYLSALNERALAKAMELGLDIAVLPPAIEGADIYVKK